MTGGQFGRLGRRCKTLACPGGRDLNCSGQSPVFALQSTAIWRCLRRGGATTVESIVLQLSLSSSPTGPSARLLIRGISSFGEQATILPAASIPNSGFRTITFTMSVASKSGPCSSLASQGYWSSRSSADVITLTTEGKQKKVTTVFFE